MNARRRIEELVRQSQDLLTRKAQLEAEHLAVVQELLRIEGALRELQEIVKIEEAADGVGTEGGGGAVATE